MNKKEKIEETVGELSTIPNEKYRKFFDKFNNIDTLPIEQWGKAELLGYFCRKYQEAYHMEYQWKFNTPSPAKCFEVWQFNTLCAKLSANPQILKDYIDWAYQNLVPKAKRRLTSISFMTKDDVVIPYKMSVLLGSKKNLGVDRSSPLPAKYAVPFQEIGVNVACYGDLAFLSQMEQTTAVALAFEKIVEIGFEMEILGRII